MCKFCDVALQERVDVLNSPGPKIVAFIGEYSSLYRRKAAEGSSNQVPPGSLKHPRKHSKYAKTHKCYPSQENG